MVAEDESTDLAPPSIQFIQSAGDLHAVLAQSREDASSTTAYKRWTTVQALKAAAGAGSTLKENEVCTVRNALYFFDTEVQNLPLKNTKSCLSVPALTPSSHTPGSRPPSIPDQT